MQASTSKTTLLKSSFCLAIALSGIAADAVANTAQMPRGRSNAAGIDATITLLGVPIADVLPTPLVAGYGIANFAHNDSMPVVNSGGITGTSLTASTTWTNNVGAVNNTSAAQAANAGVSVAGLITLGLTNVNASASVTGTCPSGGLAAAANVSVGSLTLSVLGLPVSLGALPNPLPPNYSVTVPPTAGIVGASIVLNEQVAGGDGNIVTSLDVNAAHVELDLLNLLGQATHVSLVVGSASVKADCRTDGIFEDGLTDTLL